MHKKVGLILIVLAIVIAGAIGWKFLRIGYWIKPPVEKLQTLWQEDFANLEKAKKLPAPWTEVRNVQIKADNSAPAQEWLPKLKAPVKVNAKGRYRLEVFVVHWIEKYRYGAVVEHSLIDETNGNKIWELGRTYHLGFVY